MARVARFVQPGLPYHVTHRGNRRQPLFVDDGERLIYRDLLRAYAVREGLSIWGYCLMTNHVHLLVVPARAESLARGVGLAHRRFAQRQNAAHGWTGHLFEGRYFACALDERHLWTCIRYIERNPLRAGLAADATAWAWSSAAAHARGAADDLLASERPFPGPIADWAAWLATPPSAEDEARLRQATRTGRPCGAAAWIERLEAAADRPLTPRPVGRPRKAERSRGSVSPAAPR